MSTLWEGRDIGDVLVEHSVGWPQTHWSDMPVRLETSTRFTIVTTLRSRSGWRESSCAEC